MNYTLEKILETTEYVIYVRNGDLNYTHWSFEPSRNEEKLLESFKFFSLAEHLLLNINPNMEEILKSTTPFQINDEPSGSRELKGTIFLVPSVIHFYLTQLFI
uniref:Uncharacterized protein n=1 Tax=viral metagenome TaxID=1070528 RepID=A0A6C0AFH2_9ZZZZ